MYREANREKMKEHSKTYNAENREKLAESHTCDCGGKYSWSHKDRHNESKRHKKHVLGSALSYVEKVESVIPVVSSVL